MYASYPSFIHRHGMCITGEGDGTDTTRGGGTAIEYIKLCPPQCQTLLHRWVTEPRLGSEPTSFPFGANYKLEVPAEVRRTAVSDKRKHGMPPWRLITSTEAVIQHGVRSEAQTHLRARGEHHRGMCCISVLGHQHQQ